MSLQAASHKADIVSLGVKPSVAPPVASVQSDRGEERADRGALDSAIKPAFDKVGSEKSATAEAAATSSEIVIFDALDENSSVPVIMVSASGALRHGLIEKSVEQVGKCRGQLGPLGTVELSFKTEVSEHTKQQEEEDRMQHEGGGLLQPAS
jgi:hypothetical protein